MPRNLQDDIEFVSRLLDRPVALPADTADHPKLLRALVVELWQTGGCVQDDDGRPAKEGRRSLVRYMAGQLLAGKVRIAHRRYVQVRPGEDILDLVTQCWLHGATRIPLPGSTGRTKKWVLETLPLEFFVNNIMVHGVSGFRERGDKAAKKIHQETVIEAADFLPAAESADDTPPAAVASTWTQKEILDKIATVVLRGSALDRQETNRLAVRTSRARRDGRISQHTHDYVLRCARLSKVVPMDAGESPDDWRGRIEAMAMAAA